MTTTDVVVLGLAGGLGALWFIASSVYGASAPVFDATVVAGAAYSFYRIGRNTA